MRRHDYRFLGFALGGSRFADLCLALLIGMFQLGNSRIQLCRLLFQLGPLGGLLLLPLEMDLSITNVAPREDRTASLR